MATDKKYVLGIDYGTDSCRALVVDASDGNEAGCGVSRYRRWAKGLYCDPVRNIYRQHPLDYIEALKESVARALAECGPRIAARIAGVCFDTTGSTPALIDRNGTPLALLPGFSEEPDAMFILWKDHSAVREADAINDLAHRWHTDYTACSGGTYSSEWVWSKMLDVCAHNVAVGKAAWSWAEHCDWMAALLTGNTSPEGMVRSRCAAGHKAMWNERWGGLPDREFLSTLHPRLGDMHPRLFTKAHTSGTPVGTISPLWADRLGLPKSTIVATGALDAHMGAVGASVSPGVLVRIIGTSTCDIMVTDGGGNTAGCIEGICGQVDGSVLPGYVGLEAGQSAFGDIYAWFKEMVAWPLRRMVPDAEEGKRAIDGLLDALMADAEKIVPAENLPVALDWMNGRRTPFADQNLRGAIDGLTLSTDAPSILRSLVEATVFGSRRIVEHLREAGVPIASIHAIGGIARKAPFVMQTMADVLQMPIRVIRSEQACALGSAMFASVAAGIHANIEEAQAAMASPVEVEYLPRTLYSDIYNARYQKYLFLGGCAQTI